MQRQAECMPPGHLIIQADATTSQCSRTPWHARPTCKAVEQSWESSAWTRRRNVARNEVAHGRKGVAEAAQEESAVVLVARWTQGRRQKRVAAQMAYCSGLCTAGG